MIFKIQIIKELLKVDLQLINDIVYLIIIDRIIHQNNFN